jgi:hypothetical protein
MAGMPLAPTLRWSGSDPDRDPVTFTVAFGTTNPPPVVTSVSNPYCDPSGGSGGNPPGIYDTMIAGRPARVIVGDGYDPRTPTRLAFFLHPDGGGYRIDDYVYLLAKRKGLILVSPQAPKSTDRWWQWYANPDQNIAFLSNVFEEMFARYNLCRDMLVGGSMSGGSYFYDRYFLPHRGGKYLAKMILTCGGGALGSGSGDEDDLVMRLAENPEIVARTELQYSYGSEDFLYNEIQQSINFLISSGFRVVNDEMPGVGHCHFPAAEYIRDYLDQASSTDLRYQYQPGHLSKDATYYWQITVSDGTDEVVGPVWTFTTAKDELFLPVVQR